MPLFVAQGKRLTLGLQCKSPGETTVTFKRGETDCGTATIAADGFKQIGKGLFEGRYSWTGTGLAAAENSAQITMESNKKDSTSKPQLITVFRDRLVVRAVQEDAPDVGVARARCRVTVVPDAAWLANSRRSDIPPAGYTVDKDTAAGGLLPDGSSALGAAIFEDLPYGAVTVTWLAPTTLASWVNQTGETWTAKVRSGVRTSLVWPVAMAADAEAHKQYVNLDETKARIAGDGFDAAAGPHFGSLVKVKVKVEGAAAGQTVWLGALFAATNSKRTGLPRPGLEGTPAVPNTLLVKSKAVEADGIATFNLEMGAAGGDQVSLFTAGHASVSAENHDQMTKLVTWRRLEFRPVALRVTPDAPKAPTADQAALQALIDGTTAAIEPEVRAKVAQELALAFVEARWAADEARAADAKYIGVVEGDLAEVLKLDPARKHLLWNSNDGPQLQTILYDPPFYPPRIYVFAVDKIVYLSQQKPSWSFDIDIPARGETAAAALKKASAPLPDPKGFFLLKDWRGNSSLREWSPGQPSYMQVAGSDAKIPITEEFITIVPDSQNMKATFQVPERLREATAKTAKVFLKMAVYSGLAGDTSSARVTISVGRGPAATDVPAKRHLAVSYALLHEVAHVMKIAVKNPAEAKYGPETTNPYFYERAAKDGPHCNFGLQNLAAKPWDDLSSTVSGTCLVYSPVHKATPYAQVTKFCATCLGFMKAACFGEANSNMGNYR